MTWEIVRCDTWMCVVDAFQRMDPFDTGAGNGCTDPRFFLLVSIASPLCPFSPCRLLPVSNHLFHLFSFTSSLFRPSILKRRLPRGRLLRIITVWGSASSRRTTRVITNAPMTPLPSTPSMIQKPSDPDANPLSCWCRPPQAPRTRERFRDGSAPRMNTTRSASHRSGTSQTS